MVILSTVAAIIASQAVISGAFSVTRQAIRLGFLPRLAIRHTSKEEVGQVYVPAVNWIIFAAVVALVVGFGSSEKLASAYGIAVTGTLAIDTLLFFFVVRAMWRKPMWLVIVGAIAFLTVDLTFFAANLTKVLHGGWFPLAIALVGLQRAHDLAARARDRHRAAGSRRRGRCARSSTRCASSTRPSPACPAPPSSSTPTRRRRRWRCAPTSSTTTCCTSAC